MHMMFRKVSASLTAYVLLLLPVAGQQAQAPDPNPPAPVQNQKLTKDQKQKMKKTLKELDNSFKTWLNEDVTYIISPEERTAFLQLETNEEREQFIEQFWLRRSSNTYAVRLAETLRNVIYIETPLGTLNSKPVHLRRQMVNLVHSRTVIPPMVVRRG